MVNLLTLTAPLLLVSSIITVTQAGNFHEALRSEFYNELTCPKEPVPIFEGRIRYLWLFAPGSWYMPMASEKVYRQAAEILLGRPARNQPELDLLDPRVRGLLSAPRFIGFGTKSFRKACFPINRPAKIFPRNLLEVTCFALWGTRGTDLEPARKATDSINWTDNENAVLITPCAGEDFNWFVLSKRPTISHEVKEIVLKRIAALGFSPSHASYYDYENQKFEDKKFIITAPPIVHKEVPIPVPVNEYGPPGPVDSYGPPGSPVESVEEPYAHALPPPQTSFYYPQSHPHQPEQQYYSSASIPPSMYLMNYYKKL